MLYDVIVPEPSIFFCVIYDYVTCDKNVTVYDITLTLSLKIRN